MSCTELRTGVPSTDYYFCCLQSESELVREDVVPRCAVRLLGLDPVALAGRQRWDGKAAQDSNMLVERLKELLTAVSNMQLYCQIGRAQV